MENRNSRRVYRGVVVSDKNDKTITVEVTTSKFAAHDENNEAKINDRVEIMATRPLSASKRFRLIRIIEKAVEI